MAALIWLLVDDCAAVGSILTLFDSAIIVADLFRKGCLLGVDLTFWRALKARILKFSYSSGDILSASEAT